MTDLIDNANESWDDEPCYRCDGQGWILTCVDDICHGLGYCIHGDGIADCPDCDNEWSLEAFPSDYDFCALEGEQT